MCNENTDIEFSNEASTIHLQTPNYPNEYFNNLDCNCSIRSSQTESNIQLELLEFDLESTVSSETNQIQPEPLVFNFKQNIQTCLRDYFSINSNLQLCGTLSSFQTITIESNRKQNQITSFRFTSDDALTRRGVWLKVKLTENKFKCPENFISINNVCIRIFDEMLTWYEANSYCLSLGYSLALIDNFELEKQINKALFSNEEQEFRINSNKKNLIKKFWIGIRQLNQTNWFDSKNEVIHFRQDERNWWPWLIVDSNSYNQGSCLAKKRIYFFLKIVINECRLHANIKDPKMKIILIFI